MMSQCVSKKTGSRFSLCWFSYWTCFTRAWRQRRGPDWYLLPLLVPRMPVEIKRPVPVCFDWFCPFFSCSSSVCFSLKHRTMSNVCYQGAENRFESWNHASTPAVALTVTGVYLNSGLAVKSKHNTCGKCVTMSQKRGRQTLNGDKSPAIVPQPKCN